MIDRALSVPQVYRLWQAPFVRQKMRPVLRRLDPSRVGRVLDIGCGPGTNAPLFSSGQYVGVDLNPKYIEFASMRYPGRFEVWDVTTPGPELGRFDTILINSVFHHLSDVETTKVITSLPPYLASGGSVHIIDLVLPPGPGVARLLARYDRGDFARPYDDWEPLVEASLRVRHSEGFNVGLLGVAMWSLIYIEAAVD